MALLLHVTPKEWENLKIFGAKWDSRINALFIEDYADYIKYKKWILRNQPFMNIVYDGFNVIEGKVLCPHCHNETIYIVLSAETVTLWSPEYNTIPFEQSYECIFENISLLPMEIEDILKFKYNCYFEPIKEERSDYHYYLCNHCAMCGKPTQIDEDMLANIDTISTFNLTEEENGKRIIRYLPLKYDFVMQGTDIGEDFLEYFNFKKIEMDLTDYNKRNSNAYIKDTI